MLGYSAYLKTRLHYELALVEDLGHHVKSFADITVMSHLCARVTGYQKKTYFVDSPDVMEKRLHQALGRRG